MASQTQWVQPVEADWNLKLKGTHNETGEQVTMTVGEMLEQLWEEQPSTAADEGTSVVLVVASYRVIEPDYWWEIAQ
jgi:hypothetical protein